MGRMTFAIIFGAKMPKAPRGKRWWGDSKKVGEEYVYQDGILDLWDAKSTVRVRTDEDANVIGFSVAIGSGGEDGVPSLEGPIALASFAEDRRYKGARTKARKTWDRFAALCLSEGVTMPEPTFWLVEIEVA